MLTLIFAQLVDGILMGGLYVVVALGLTSLFSVFRIINLAHGALIMVGAYITFYAAAGAGLNFFIALLISMVGTGLLLLLIERIVFRKLQGRTLLIQMVASMAITFIVESSALAIFRTRPRTLETGLSNEAINFFGLNVSPQRIFLLVIAVIVIIALQLLYKRTKLGLASRAIAQNRESAMAVGIDSGTISMFNFFLSGALAGIAGGLLGAATAVTPAMGIHPLIKGLIVVIIGGLGSIGGAVAGGFLLGIIDSLSSLVMIGGVQQAIPFLIFLIVLCLRPTGLFGREFH